MLAIVGCADDSQRVPNQHAAALAHDACYWFELRLASSAYHVRGLEDSSWAIREGAYSKLYGTFGVEGESYYLYGCQLCNALHDGSETWLGSQDACGPETIGIELLRSKHLFENVRSDADPEAAAERKAAVASIRAAYIEAVKAVSLSVSPDLQVERCRFQHRTDYPSPPL